MEKGLAFLVGKLTMNKSGFTLIEMLLVLSITSICLFFAIPLRKHDFQSKTLAIYEMEEIIEMGRSMALCENRKVALRFSQDGIYVDGKANLLSGVIFEGDSTIYFKENGHILNPTTIVFSIHDKNYRLIFNLGQGVYHIE